MWIRLPNGTVQEITYAEYLRTQHWRTLRQKRIDADGGVCALCGSPMGLQVHHLTYEALGKEDICDLITLCFECHGKVHALNDQMQKEMEEESEKLSKKFADLFVRAGLYENKKKATRVCGRLFNWSPAGRALKAISVDIRPVSHEVRLASERLEKEKK